MPRNTGPNRQHHRRGRSNGDGAGRRRPPAGEYSLIIDDSHQAESRTGEWVLVHVGFAMSRLDEDEAERMLALLHELDEIQAEEEAMRASAEA